MTRQNLTEVICSHPTRGRAAFGVTFHDDKEAAKFIEAMQAHGYEAEPMDYYTEKDADEALRHCAEYFNDERLKQTATA